MSLGQLGKLILDRYLHPDEKENKVCLFLGAGTDIGSNGLTFSEFKRSCLEKISNKKLFKVSSHKEIDDLFQDIFSSKIAKKERGVYVEQIFRTMEEISPSNGYKLLLLLIEAHAIDAVVTTNWDTMLEESQKILKKNVLNIFSPGLAKPYPVNKGSYDFPKCPYVKIHGDLSTKVITILTNDEIENSDYDPEMVDLINHLFSTHRIIFCGYGGYDSDLSKIISKAVGKSEKTIFWCSPSTPAKDAPLVKKIYEKLEFIESTFDELIHGIAKSVLERIYINIKDPVFIPKLLEWRISYKNDEYLREYYTFDGDDAHQLFVKRRDIEKQIDKFLRSTKQMTAIVGPSGYGKSTFGALISKRYPPEDSAMMLMLKSKSLTEPKIEQLLLETLGLSIVDHTSGISFLERWLKKNKKQLVVFLDGINEYDTDLGKCRSLLKNIIRFCYFLPTNSSIKLILSVRQEAWNAMLPDLDRFQLDEVMWSRGLSNDSMSAIEIGKFSDSEVEQAIKRFYNAGYISKSFRQFPNGVKNVLKDPQLLSLWVKSGKELVLKGPTSSILLSLIKHRLTSGHSTLNPSLLLSGLSAIAFNCFLKKSDKFRYPDLAEELPNGSDQIRNLIDLGILSEYDQGYLRFTHDRIYQCLLAESFKLPSAPPLETADELLDVLVNTSGDKKMLVALRQYFILNLDNFSVIEDCFNSINGEKETFTQVERQTLFSFTRDVLFELVEDQPDFAEQYIRTVINTAINESVPRDHLRTIIQAASLLKDEHSIDLLCLSSNCVEALPKIESHIYVTDKLVKRLMGAINTTDSLMNDSPFCSFFNEKDLPSWRQVGRILGLLSQLGPDNCHPDEYKKINSLCKSALIEIKDTSSWTHKELDEITQFILENSDRYLFNATESGIKRFFQNTRRGELLKILDKLERGGIITFQDIETLKPFLENIDYDIEFQLAHMLFVISASNNFSETMRVWNDYFKSLDNNSAPELVDFFDAVTLRMYVVLGVHYDNVLEEKITHIFKNMPDVLLHSPGLERGYSRGYKDPFDMVFEDGFNPIAAHAVLYPGIYRRQLYYKDYIQFIDNEENALSQVVPFFRDYLLEFLKNNQTNEALRILHSFSQLSFHWPQEGLCSLLEILGHRDPIIQKAAVRILSETYARHPMETLCFLERHSSSLTEEDLHRIKVKSDPRVGNRQFEGLQWARVLHFIFSLENGQEYIIRSLRVLLRSGSLSDAIANGATVAGFYEIGR